MKGVVLSALFNPAAITIIILTVTSVIIATNSFRTFINGFHAVISANYIIEDAEREKAIGLFRLLSKSVIMAVLVATLISALATLGHVDDLVALGTCIATMIATPMLGLMIAMAIFEPVVYILKHPIGKEFADVSAIPLKSASSR